jgi:YD repeat-containing protein
MKIFRLALGLIALGAPGVALATPETITYTYDHQGHVLTSTRAGGPSDGVKQQYWYDNADNRTRMKVTGSSNPPPVRPAKPKS